MEEITGIVVSSVFAVIGIIFFIVGLSISKNYKKKQINCTISTTGKVVDLVKEKTRNVNSRSYSYTWRPVFEYNIGELKYIKKSYMGTSQPKYAIGQNVEIYYNPDDHNEFYVKGDNLANTLGKIFIGVGVGALAVAVLGIVLTYILQ